MQSVEGAHTTCSPTPCEGGAPKACACAGIQALACQHVQATIRVLKAQLEATAARRDFWQCQKRMRSVLQAQEQDVRKEVACRANTPS